MPKRNLAARAGHWSARHRKTAIFGWLAFVVIAFVLGGAIGTNSLEPEDTGNGSSAVADKAIAAADFPDKADEQVLVTARDGGLKASDPQFRQGVDTVVAQLQKTKHVEEIASPYEQGNEGQISKGQDAALVTFSIKGDSDATDERVDSTLNATKAAQQQHPDLRIEQFGDASADKALSASLDDDFKRAEFLSLPITLIILIVAFGALVAAGVPLLLGITAVIGTLGLVAPISQIIPMEESAASVILLIGLAVGVDYSLFYLRRKMEERDAGRSSEAALEFAAATSGKAVLISGLTVLIAMAGMFIAGNAVFTSFAVGTMLVVAVAMLGSVTVLPAVISKLGDKVEKGRVPFIGRLRHRNHGESRVWNFVIDRSLRRPVLAVVLSAGFLLLLAYPALHMRTVNPGAAGLPHDLPIMQTYERIQDEFPGGPMPAIVAIQAKDVTTPEVQDGIKALIADASGPTSTIVSPNKEVAIVSIPLPGNGTDDASEAALATLRDKTIPATIDRVPGAEANVTGMTAGSKDFNDRMNSRLPFVFAFVLGLAFLLLLVTFRSIVIPLKAIVLNLLSVGAAYGVMTWIFQDGHLEGLLNFESVGGITSWLPLFMFVILFGLSMDYHVFILSRIREAFDRGESTEDAVAHGIKATAGVVTSAAIVMVAVFAIFATLSMIEFKQMGVGLAVAILLDATLVRAVLLPAAMKLLGERNWYLPRGLRWLPKWDHEPTPEPVHA
ncbi:MMPL family transporter [Solirubrobacter sp. CPCC 204708]|uniref:MMPL family transporter n=1 Tax=Solirubrobacter deserti TaxID=2282478 RepID=A0ABT4RLL5_9ACTN|nr:MMPL family transporter [Solirubrobacter deserti]MBE2316698.1 MMPL family transporter [Solirubrobacter deserti]MDA0139455.1 MMPL family transporter [Solirubrobacter deserti]